MEGKCRTGVRALDTLWSMSENCGNEILSYALE